MKFAALFLAGAALWTLLEWAIHNGLGHHGKGRNPFGKEHLRHHATTDYFAPPWRKALVALIVAGGIWALLQLALPALGAAVMTAGLLAAYVGYEVIHLRCHTRPPQGRYGRWVRRHHFHHHFQNPRVNHGVSTPIWDLVFGTYVPVTGPVTIPRRAAVPWLIDPETGDVRPRFAADYRTIRRGAAR